MTLVKATFHLCAHGYYYGIYVQHVSASAAHRYQELLVCPRVYLCHPQPEIAVLLFICLEEGNIPYYPLFPILTLKPRCCFRSGARRRVASTLWYIAEQSLEMREKLYLTVFFWCQVFFCTTGGSLWESMPVFPLSFIWTLAFEVCVIRGLCTLKSQY